MERRVFYEIMTKKSICLIRPYATACSRNTLKTHWKGEEIVVQWTYLVSELFSLRVCRSSLKDTHKATGTYPGFKLWERGLKIKIFNLLFITCC
jgi:hypothetical protein